MSRASRATYEHFQWCPVDFSEREPTTDPATAQRARQLSDELQTAPQRGEASETVAESWELNLAGGSPESAVAPWIQAWKTYEFRLYAGTEHTKMLAETQVTGHK